MTFHKTEITEDYEKRVCSMIDEEITWGTLFMATLFTFLFALVASVVTTKVGKVSKNDDTKSTGKFLSRFALALFFPLMAFLLLLLFGDSR